MQRRERGAPSGDEVPDADAGQRDPRQRARRAEAADEPEKERSGEDDQPRVQRGQGLAPRRCHRCDCMPPVDASFKDTRLREPLLAPGLEKPPIKVGAAQKIWYSRMSCSPSEHEPP